MSADEKRIREFAYQIWESEGQPSGQDERHWEMARKLAEAEALAPDKSSARKATKPKLPKVDGAADPKPAPGKASKPAAAPASKPAPSAKPAAKPAVKPKPPAASTQAEQPAKSAQKKPRKP
ncbi:Protein of uncharacterised function (DUF2934) [Paucimonas lemoignei]|nr:Protein of uncharacterised function (DUF2934) [Paucimonas lemoignei]